MRHGTRPAEGQTPAPPRHRPIPASQLLSDYGFDADEGQYEENGNLPLALDPKAAWALAHPERFPMDVETASREELVRVPGVGPLTARRIVGARMTTVIRGLADLRKIGVLTTRAAGFLSLRGRKLATSRWTEQLGFWAPENEVGAYHVTYQVSPGTFR